MTEKTTICILIKKEFLDGKPKHMLISCLSTIFFFFGFSFWIGILYADGDDGDDDDSSILLTKKKLFFR